LRSEEVEMLSESCFVEEVRKTMMKDYYLPIFSFLLAGCVCISFAAQSTTVTREFPAGETGTLNVSVNSGDIEIRTGLSEVRVKATGIRAEDQAALTISQEGSTVDVAFDPRNGRSNPHFEIGLPAGFDLNLKTSGGDVSIDGFLAGSLTAKTAGGDIEMGDVEGDVQARTAGGDIESGVLGAKAELRTAGGDIEVRSVGGEVKAETAGGDIEIGDVGSRLEAATAGGDIILKNVGGEASAKTAGGDVIVGDVAGSATLKTAGGDVRLSSAAGRVEAKTAGGDLYLKGVSGSIEGKTAGGDIAAELIPTGSGPSRLTTAGGDIQLSMPASSGARVIATIEVQPWEDNGDYTITSEFGSIEVVRVASAHELRAEFTVGGGGAEIVLRTTNGDISIQKMGM
jgi:DUF4097 and DUF4098 domain-containing protein YvlB